MRKVLSASLTLHLGFSWLSAEKPNVLHFKCTRVQWLQHGQRGWGPTLKKTLYSTA